MKKKHNIKRKVVNKKLCHIIWAMLFFIIAIGFVLSDKIESISEAKVLANNKGKKVDNQFKTIDKDSWNLILVNTKTSLPQNFKVDLTELSYGHKVDSRIYEELQNMFNDARKQGLKPKICSSYRTREFQVELLRNEVDTYVKKGYSYDEAAEEAKKWVAVPGSSEHETGLALDIVSEDYQILDKAQEDTAEQRWLMENSYKYGFILRYPSNKTDITGINYEPWHYRYVGKEVATEMKEKGLCLEEYLIYSKNNN